MFSPVLVTPPAVQPVTLAEAKLHLRIEADVNEEDALVQSLIAAATAHFDGWSGTLGRCLINQTWSVPFGSWPSDGLMRLPFPNISSPVVTYRDINNATQTVSGSLVFTYADHLGTTLRLSDTFTYPPLFDDTATPITVQFTAGYGATGIDVPAPIRQAMLLLIGHLYQNREAAISGGMAQLPLGIAALVAPYRKVSA
jgi:uncharacterized phiE125 gp8 family phage protein